MLTWCPIFRDGSKSYHQSWHLNCLDLNSTPSSVVLKRYTRNWSSHKSSTWTGELCTVNTSIPTVSLVSKRSFYVRQVDDFTVHMPALFFTVISQIYTVRALCLLLMRCLSVLVLQQIFHTCTGPFWHSGFALYRYLHKNIGQTHERRGEVKKLKEQLAALQQKLEW